MKTHANKPVISIRYIAALMTTLASATCIAQSNPASMATPPSMPMSKAAHDAQKGVIAAEYKVGKATCKSLADNAKDTCMAAAKGKEKVAYAELEYAYKPSVDTRYKVRVAKAESDYAVSREKCDDQAGNLKDVCVKQAKATQTSAKADAKAQMKVVDARNVATDKTTAARSDAAVEKTNADYAVAIEKCSAFAGDAKDKCVKDSKLAFGKN